MDDNVFIRGQVPMTKSEVRAVSLSKLHLNKDSVLYDVGAGTGSVSVEACLTYPGLTVYAIEKNEQAAELLKQNREKFQVTSMTIVKGQAPEVLEGLPIPSHAFLGGSAGNMKAILDLLFARNPQIRIVVNVISLETLSLLLSYLKEAGRDGEIVQIQVSRARVLGSHHMMEGQNPIYVISFGGGGCVAE